MFFRADAQEKGGEACIREKYFGGLDQRLSDVFEERRQVEHDIRRFQHGEPAPDGSGRYTHIVPERSEVDDLSNPTRQQREEFLKLRQVTQLDQSAPIALHIGLQVAIVEPSRFETLFVKPRETSADDQVEGAPRRFIPSKLTKG